MWVGIDVSKAWLDVHLDGAEGGLRVPSLPSGQRGRIGGMRPGMAS